MNNFKIDQNINSEVNITKISISNGDIICVKLRDEFSSLDNESTKKYINRLKRSLISLEQFCKDHGAILVLLEPHLSIEKSKVLKNIK